MKAPHPGPLAVLVEAFTDQACQGNGAAVVLLDQPVADAAMQALARSLNQSETAFLLPCPGGWALRWFTPSCEVPLCGHATLAALVALQHWGLLTQGTAATVSGFATGAGAATGTATPAGSIATTFWTRSGTLPVALEQGMAQLSLPAVPLQSAVPPAYLVTVLKHGLDAEILGFWRSSLGYSVVLLPAEAPLALMASPAPLLQAEEATGLVLMQAISTATGPFPAVAGTRAHDQLRFIAPALGIDEDPVTGSAHALVAPYWLARSPQPTVVGWQCSPKPGGMVCETAASGMIRLSGTGVLLWSGQLNWQPEQGDAAVSAWQHACQLT